MQISNLDSIHLVLLIVFAAGGSLSGKTLLQKRGYFLSVLLDVALNYRPHYYGPYSPSIEDGISRAKGLGFLEERTLGFGIADEIGFEVRRYDYVLTDDGRAVVQWLQEQYRDETKAILDSLLKISSAGDLDYVSLSIAAKSYYILTDKKSAMTVTEIQSAAQKLGWKISETAKIQRAVEFLKNVDLVSTTSLKKKA